MDKKIVGNEVIISSWFTYILWYYKN